MNYEFDNQDYIPQKVGLTFTPPTIIIEYLVPSKQKLYHHQIKLQRLTENSDIDDLVRYVRKRHFAWIDGRMTDDQLETLISKLQYGLKKTQAQKKFSQTTYDKPQTSITSKPQISNADNIKVEVYKQTISNISKQQQPLSKQFQPTTPNIKASETDSKHQTKINNNSSQFTNSYTSFNSNKSKSKIEQFGFEEVKLDDDDDDYPQKDVQPIQTQEEEYGEDFEEFEESVNEIENSQESQYDYNNLNLNQMTPEEVEHHKQKMNVVFAQNNKKPGDPGFVYDKQIEFKPTKSSGWDDDD